MSIACPKCGSTQLHSDKKWYSVKKGALGFFVTGGIGLMGGLIGSNKIKITCLACGHSFSPIDKKTLYNQNSIYSTVDIEKIAELKKARDLSAQIKNRDGKPKKVMCLCGNLNELHFKFCRVCGNQIDTSKMEIVHNGQYFEYCKCPNCNQLTPKKSKKNKFCVNCGKSNILNEK